MNPHRCRVALRPRDPFEVFDLTLRLIRERWAVFAKLAAWTVLPWLLLFAPLCWLVDGNPATVVLPFLLASLVQAPFTVAAGRLLFADEISQWDIAKAVVQRSPVLIGTWVVSGLGALIGMATCGLMVPVIQAWLAYLTEAALLERVGLARCVRRSSRLAGAHMGIALATGVSWWFLTAWFALLFELTGHAIVHWVLQLGQPFGALSDGYVTPYLLAGVLVAQPLHAVYRLLLYVDIRTRVEGWDLQVALRAAGMEAAA